MDKFLLASSIVFFFWVMAKKKIPWVSLYTLFGVQWAFYWFFPLMIAIDFYQRGLMGGYYLNYNNEIQFYFFLFNAISMFCFASAFLFFYGSQNTSSNASQNSISSFIKYRNALFLVLFVMNAVLIVLSVKFPYTSGAGWAIHSLTANMRNIFVALFFMYMLSQPKRSNIYFLFSLFCFSTFIYGGRLYLAILATGFVFYFYDNKVFKLKHVALLLVAAVLFLSLTGLVRSGLGKNFERASLYALHPIFTESVYSSYPGFSLIHMWKNSEIKYYTYFGSYIFDSIMIFVPHFVFRSAGTPKDSYNILGKWEEDHGGRHKISPQGSYYYLAEAMEALAIPGIVIVSFGFALACLFMEKIRHGTDLIGRYAYYNFVGTFGFGFVKSQFSWSARYFLQDIFAVLIFIALFEIFRGAAAGVESTQLEVLTRD